MDPASIIGIAASTASILKILFEASLGLQTALRDIRSVDEAAEGIAGELEAFRSILLVFETEIGTSDLLPNVQRWWDSSNLEQMLSNAVNTLSRLNCNSQRRREAKICASSSSPVLAIKKL